MKKLFTSVIITSFFLTVFIGLPPSVFAYNGSAVNLQKAQKLLQSSNSVVDISKLGSNSQMTKVVSSTSSTSVPIKNGLVKKLQVKNDYVDGEILVKYKDTKINLNTVSGRSAALNFSSAKSLEKKEDLKKNNISIFRIKDAKTVEQKIIELKNDPNVEYSEPNYRRYPSSINTNDTNKGLLWGLDNTGQTINGSYGNVTGTNDKDIDAPEAWAINEGASSTVIVAIIDSGVAYNHPDLAANMWNGTNCKDENGSSLGGCVHGYDYEDGDKIPLPTTSTHGTHIAGTIASVKNNSRGIIGVAPNAKIMAIKYNNTVLEEVKAIDFAIQNGAKVINASFAGGAFSQAEYDAINRFKSYGGIFVAAAGNENVNNDSVHSYPSDYDLDNIISVAATDQNDNLATFSNYSATSVDVGAPGANIYSTVDESMLFFESFETVTTPSVPAGWTKGGTSNNWGTYDFGVGTFWGKALYADLSFPYANNVNTTITSASYNLGSGTSGAVIDFWTKCDTEYITNGWADYMQLEYSADGVNFLPATDPYFGGDFRWDEPTLDILSMESPASSVEGSIFHYSGVLIPSQYLTSNFKFRFRWVSSASDNNYDGCLIDDVKLTKYTDGSEEQYGYKNGTSMAAPHVAGLAALIEGYNPALTSTQVKNIILTTGDSVSSLLGKTVTGKRINAWSAIKKSNPIPDVTIPIITLKGDSEVFIAVGSIYVDDGVTAMDNIDGDLSSNVNITGLPINTSGVGVYTVTYNVSDSSGNVATSVSRTVNVNVFNPIIGFIQDNVIPANQISQATDGSGIITINFKVKDNFANINIRLGGFSYSLDDGVNWVLVNNYSEALSLNWYNSTNIYKSSLDYSANPYSFTFNTKHSDITGFNNLRQNNVKFRFAATDGHVMSPYAVSERISVDNTTTSNHTISGTVKYYDGIKVVPNAIVTLESNLGIQIATTTTNASGTYQFTNVTDGGNYVVRVSKSDNNAGLSSADQIKIGRHIVGTEPFSSIYKTIAGDVNNSGSLSSSDQIKIGRFIVGLDSGLISGYWKFYSNSAILSIGNYLTNGLTRTFNNVTGDMVGQDFVGVKMGDVNNSWINN